MFIYHEIGRGSSVAWLLTLIVLAISIIYNQALYRER
jgi:ABC-type sugar transport system permease subunit